MGIFIAVIGSLFAIFGIIVLHELGHFAVAKAFGVQVLRFSIGFGKALWTWRDRSGTEYVLAVLPFGGYVKMLEEVTTEDPLQDRRSAFSAKPLWVRALIVVAGPTVNFCLAVVLYWVVFCLGVLHLKPIVGSVTPHSIAQVSGIKAGDHVLAVGNKSTVDWQDIAMELVQHGGDQTPVTVWVSHPPALVHASRLLNVSTWRLDRQNPDVLDSLGIEPLLPSAKPILDIVAPKSPAEQAGFKPGDRVVALEGKPIHEWAEVARAVRVQAYHMMHFTIVRQGALLQLSVLVGGKRVGGQTIGYLGVAPLPTTIPPELLIKVRYSLFSAWAPAFFKMTHLVSMNIHFLWKMITGQLSTQLLGGPISIFQAAGQASQAGIVPYLEFVAFLSVTIGFVNLLPIPGLDGGHLLFYGIEAVIRRPVSERVQWVALCIGVAALLLLLLRATFNDLVRLFGWWQ